MLTSCTNSHIYKGNKGLYPPPDELPVWSAAQHNEGRTLR